jgi:hypothetical protein
VVLFTPEELGDLLHTSVPEPQGTIAERMASGWLRGATGLASWPEPLPDDLWAWALELGVLAYTNPEGLTAETISNGDYTTGRDRHRKEAILAEARRCYAVDTSGFAGSLSMARPGCGTE